MKCRVEKQKVFTAKRVWRGQEKAKRILITAAAVGTAAGVIGVGAWVASNIHLRPAEDRAEVARSKAAVTFTPCQLSDLPAYEPEPNPRLEFYAEGDSPIPAWYKPDEPMAVEWVDHSGEDHFPDAGKVVDEDMNVLNKAEPHPPVGVDPGGVDWNLCTTIWGWAGHGAEAWELDLFAKIFYREFWQPNLTLCEAGCDAMLGLWDLYGGTLFETLSHVNEDGSYTFSTYPGVWEIEYDPDGLAWCKAFCEERFYEGPVWPAQYFRKGHYHDWGEWSPIPAYEIDGIYFSIGKEQ